ncbi:GIY-YIG nuclease family protein [Bacillus benzoevorans]|uniref:Excinuclease UvrABC nuclease subunit n=1 Tax=Bacillus benzoevorans TaxID=1456 RepID=A0A7X0HTH3_9BACI|nr:GIY-YIG nuclease family protein [Bacillus benzoevorans]MBB6446550.1 excinuclease UvrABC nuclease subunit [Bacillus benzoevorans]
MIKIGLPDPSATISVSKIHKVKAVPGFYFMRDINGTIIYIGESLNINQRLNKHILGKSSVTREFHHEFHSVDVFYCDKKERRIYEIFAINLYDPIGNVDDNDSADKKELQSRRNKWIDGLKSAKP